MGTLVMHSALQVQHCFSLEPAAFSLMIDTARPARIKQCMHKHAIVIPRTTLGTSNKR